MAMIRSVDAKVIQGIFNNEGFWEKVKNGQLVEVVRSNRHPAAPEAPVPICTRSQMVSYHDPVTNKKVAMVHQYLQPDGTLGASKKPDPKFVFHDGVRYQIRVP